ncbi:NAD(P)/FAD-dependent oxidoreductase [Pleurocapsales cyanobacterium LEGE 10410]|nr:NAD(P)/FAD-dependent oxidoreductase [Pleurocapsales cyanobacterium LEGE 10410]
MLRKKPRIVIVGAGFAGLRAIRQLARVHAEIILIDRNNYHTFVPLLYQVATGFVPPEVVTYPLRKYLRSSNASFIQAEVQKIDFAARTVETQFNNLAYDYLVLATGSQTQFLGVDGAAEYALPMRTLDDAVRIHDRLISNFERATVCQDWERKAQLLTITIIGGGATGVELAGSIRELVEVTLAKDYPAIDPQQVRVILIHSGTRPLQDYPEHLGNYTVKQLRRRGVKVHLQSRVSEVLPGAIKLDDGTLLETATIIWTAGVEANYPQPEGKLDTASKSKIRVEPTLQLSNHPEVYAVGDTALVEHNGQPLLGIAPEALQQGTTVAQNLKRQLRGLSPKPFNYFNKGKAAIIARNSGVAYLFGRIPLQGFFAWLLWLGIHLYYLPGIANRSITLLSWIRDYITRERSLRQLFKHRQVHPQESLTEYAAKELS